MNILEKIVAAKLEYLEYYRNTAAHAEMKKAAVTAVAAPSFKEAISKPGLSIVGEIKKASPSRGLIDPIFDYLSIAKEYNTCVDAISVLTEEKFFMGSPEYLKAVAGVVDIPVLRKDFIIDSCQIFESKVLGAACVLLITSILDSVKIKSFIKLCMTLGMDSLVEVHNETELYRALRAGAEIIGINNRNLNDFSINLRNTENLMKIIPDNVLCISESGIKTHEDARYIKQVGADGVLIGESFMICESKSRMAEELKNA